MSAIDKTLEKIEEIIKQGNLSFDYGFSFVNKNYSTNKNYSGVFNNLVLSIDRYDKGYKFPYWIGFGQAQKSFIPVKKGEKGVPILCYKQRKVFLNINEEEVDENSSDAVFTKNSSYFDTVYVWNIEQTSIDIDSVNAFQFSENTDELEILLDKYRNSQKIELIHDDVSTSFYSVKSDIINLVPFESFYDKLAYFEAYTHECMHSTGHGSRLNREMTRNDKEKYCNEEIIAEFGTMVLMSEFNLERRDKDMATYINSYLVYSDIKSIYNLCKQSQQAVDFIKMAGKDEKSVV